MTKREKREKIAEAKAFLQGKILKFRKKHLTSCFCLAGSGKRAVVIQQSIFVCDIKCKKQCRHFGLETYLCRDLGCQNWQVCALSAEKVRRKYCKKFNLTKERDALRRRYRYAFTLMRLSRQLISSPNAALKTLDEMKKKKVEKEKKNGKVLSKKSEGTNKKKRKEQADRNEESFKNKKVNANIKKKRKKS